jgi:hypothetical protein
MNTAAATVQKGSHSLRLIDGSCMPSSRAYPRLAGVWGKQAHKDTNRRAPIPTRPAHRAPPHSKVRSKVEPRDIPPMKAARRLHLTLEEFYAKLPELQARGFPAPDPTTGMFDLKAIDTWADARNPRIFKKDAETESKKDARQVVKDRLERFGGDNGHG